MRAAVEGFAALVAGALSRNSDRHQDFPLKSALPHGVIAVVGQKNRLIGTYRRAMRALENPIAPRAEKVAVAVKNNDRMFATRKTVNLILSVNCDGCHFVETPAAGQGAPVFNHFVPVITAS
jgi:hypothetical protein